MEDKIFYFSFFIFYLSPAEACRSFTHSALITHKTTLQMETVSLCYKWKMRNEKSYLLLAVLVLKHFEQKRRLG